MDALIAAAGHALAKGDVLGALKRVALRDDAPARALRGIAMAQLGDFDRARALLKQAARGFGAREPVARARCILAQAEIALVSRDLAWPEAWLADARQALEVRGDRLNAAHAQHLQVRRLLLLGRLDDAETELATVSPTGLPPALQTAHALAEAGIAMRRVRASAARGAIHRARTAAAQAGIAALATEVELASNLLEEQSARLVTRDEDRTLTIDDIERLLASDQFVVDACRSAARLSGTSVALATRPVLFALLRTLAETWPGEAPRELLLARAFGAKFTDESHRARLRVEIARLRDLLRPLAEIEATRLGFILVPPAGRAVAVLAPPGEQRHAGILALLADGEAWSSSALATVLGTSTRTVQRALEELAGAGKVQSFGRGPALRWIAPAVPGFPTLLLLPGPLPGD